jgi:hypothetical protein
VKRLATLLVPIALIGGVLVAASAAGVDKKAGFHTSTPALLDGANGSTTKPIISVGDTLGSGFMFESIPDGISVGKVNGKGTFDIYVNHELSQVPFGNLGGTPPQTRADATNSLLGKLRLHQKSAGVLKGSYVIPSSAGYQRFCSNFAVGKAQGFDRNLILTNEEARDIVLRQEDSWHQPGVSLAEPNAEQAGVAVAYDVKSGAYKSIYSMGRSNHENEVAVPGYGHPVVFTGDDTFDAPGSQLYMLSAASGSAFWNDQGTLYAFVSDTAGINDYGDLTTASPSVTGHFVPVPEAIAKGKVNGHEAKAADFGYPAPPSAAIPDGPQWVLEYWSQNVAHAFQFIRIEDLAYDRTNGKVLYFADTGEPRAKPDAATGVLKRDSTGGGPYMNGRLYKLALNSSDPTGSATLSILPGANFDDNGYNSATSPHQPDNVETTASAIYFTEDPGSHNSQPTFAGATNARVWKYDLVTHALTVVAEVNQQTALSGVANKGAWEASGIVDVSRIFGPGSFLLDVQAHGWELPGTIPSNDANIVPKRERGQLLLLKVPGEPAVSAAGHGKGKKKGKK